MFDTFTKKCTQNYTAAYTKKDGTGLCDNVLYLILVYITTMPSFQTKLSISSDKLNTKVKITEISIFLVVNWIF